MSKLESVSFNDEKSRFKHWRRQNDNWGGGGGGRIFIYVRSAKLTSFEIDYFYSLWTQIMNICPLSYRSAGATGFKREQTREIVHASCS